MLVRTHTHAPLLHPSAPSPPPQPPLSLPLSPSLFLLPPPRPSQWYHFLLCQIHLASRLSGILNQLSHQCHPVLCCARECSDLTSLSSSSFILHCFRPTRLSSWHLLPPVADGNGILGTENNKSLFLPHIHSNSFRYVCAYSHTHVQACTH